MLLATIYYLVCVLVEIFIYFTFLGSTIFLPYQFHWYPFSPTFSLEYKFTWPSSRTHSLVWLAGCHWVYFPSRHKWGFLPHSLSPLFSAPLIPSPSPWTKLGAIDCSTPSQATRRRRCVEYRQFLRAQFERIRRPRYWQQVLVPWHSSTRVTSIIFYTSETQSTSTVTSFIVSLPSQREWVSEAEIVVIEELRLVNICLFLEVRYVLPVGVRWQMVWLSERPLSLVRLRMR